MKYPLFWFYNISLFIASVLGAEQFLLRRFPSTRDFIEQIRPLRSFIGAVVFFIGVFEMFDILQNHYHVVSRLFTAILMLLLGYVQGQETLTRIRAAFRIRTGMQKIYATIYPYQELLGLLGIMMFLVNIFRKHDFF